MDRRGFLVATSALALSCRRRSEPPAAATTFDVLDWEMEAELGGDKRCVVLVPHAPKPGTRFPLLVALHGMGETTTPRKGAYGWLESYTLGRTLDRLAQPPLTASDFHGLVTPARLGELNAALSKQPFGGLVIACPYLPRGIGSDVPYEVYGRWLGERLLPRLRAETPVVGTAQTTGIDGVSLGGITALRVGLERADLFGAVGALQPAVVGEESVDALAAAFSQKLSGRPLRIVTSTEDAFRPALVALDSKLGSRGVKHELFISEGPHDYVWNQGPGAIEMLVWHDRTLRRG